ncbi:MAG: methyltransferase [Candidatus Omnitrophica bacterium]|nr:methyltransferase [Candidatus Omnitrophota bacterium]MDD5080837.1 methyltransferase [Candidatus Omnitrophota bacterium]MDD5441535.1 methyltransferase [Candidatus Omnitrophota bacterium]
MLLTKKDILLLKNLPDQTPSMFTVDYGLRSVNAIRNDNKINLENYSFSLSGKFKDDLCYLVNSEGIHPIAFFDEKTKKHYKLLATPDWPTTAISSVPMHRVASPKIDSENKITSLQPHGKILDTCTGMGYTAILCAKTCREIYTFEKDPNMIFLAKLNPCSEKLFSAPNIKIHEKDINTAIYSLPSDFFDYIVHDPPTYKMAPDLFSEKFYKELHRILKIHGKMFHYVPLYRIKSGYDFPSTIARKLKSVCFDVSAFNEKTSGFICRKRKLNS